MPALEYKRVEFTIKDASYNDLRTFRPDLSYESGWYYLGPVARSDKVPDKAEGLIVKAVESDALADIVEWKRVGNNPEPQAFATWRGIPPAGYLSGGDVFVVPGNDPPSEEQTRGIKAIRKDLVGESEPHRHIWTGRLPWLELTLWDIIISDLLHVPTGAFLSAAGPSPVGLELVKIRFNAW